MDCIIIILFRTSLTYILLSKKNNKHYSSWRIVKIISWIVFFSQFVSRLLHPNTNAMQ